MLNMHPQELVDRYGSKRQAAIALRISRQTLYNWLRKGKIPEGALERLAAAKALEIALAKVKG